MEEELGAPRGRLAESDGELGGVVLVKICVVGAAFGVEFGQLGQSLATSSNCSACHMPPP